MAAEIAMSLSSYQTRPITRQRLLTDEKLQWNTISKVSQTVRICHLGNSQTLSSGEVMIQRMNQLQCNVRLVKGRLESLTNQRHTNCVSDSL
jgi:hypothetical protein